ncbi:predicted protein [Histoplasma capsulatum H143]|uniref:Uncharacterized protein n=1 Tax=Ajellomyces capsulatus (strain H143) TaxID=544712 RepID=C6H6P3_AJECH|nr:predicted protein [Histoplasma capsulatum H143]
MADVIQVATPLSHGHVRCKNARARKEWAARQHWTLAPSSNLLVRGFHLLCLDFEGNTVKDLPVQPVPSQKRGMSHQNTPLGILGILGSGIMIMITTVVPL